MSLSHCPYGFDFHVGDGSFCFSGGERVANKPLHPCNHAGCWMLTTGRYCPRHAPMHEQDRKRGARKSPEAQARHKLYTRTGWKAIRAEQLAKEPFCAACARLGLRVRATDVDHIQPHGGDRQLFADKTNLQSLCHACHSRKTAAETWRNRRK